MSLYDDLDTPTTAESKKPDSNVAGWASGIKFLQSHMQLKKAAVTLPKRDMTRKNTSTLAPVIDFKAREIKDESSDEPKAQFSLPFPMILPKETKKHKGTNRILSSYLAVDPEWQFDNEYDPLWPNDYDKAVKELRERRDREAEEEEKRRKTEDDSGTDLPSSRDRDRDDDRRSRGGRSGAQIAPPPSLSQPSFNEPDSTSSYTGPSVGGGAAAAAKIMAKYGYKEGQGLGKKEQGMSTALQVQKTSFRIGRIIHEKDMVSVPNPLGLASSMAAYNDIEDEEYEDMKPPVSVKEEDEAVAIAESEQKKESTLAEILKNPSNILLLKNMVAPGEVDDDLEPEVKEECSKYGQVNNVTVFQMPDMDGEDAIRIFVEFASVDPAVKGFMDLDGRFFGGRQVKASFYNADKYNNLELTE